MRKLDVSAVAPGIGLPLKSGSLTHIQNAYTEAIAEAVKGFVGPGYNSFTPYILQGLNNSGSGNNWNISAGSVFFDGEVYQVDAAAFTTSGSQVPVMQISTTFYTSGITADGVQFTDGNTRNIHQIRKIQLVAGLAGSGIANYASAQRVYTNIPPVNLIQGAGVSITGSYPNFTISATQQNSNPVLLATSIYIGDLNSTADLDQYTTLLSGGSSGFCGYRYIFPQNVGTDQYVPVGILQHDFITTTADASNNYMLGVQFGQRSAGDIYFFLQTSATSNVQLAWVKLILLKANILYA